MKEIVEMVADMELLDGFLGMKGRFVGDMVHISIADLAQALRELQAANQTSYDPSASLYGEGEEERMKHGAAKRDAGENPAGIATPLSVNQTGAEDVEVTLEILESYANGDEDFIDPSYVGHAVEIIKASLTAPNPQPVSAALGEMPPLPNLNDEDGQDRLHVWALMYYNEIKQALQGVKS